MLGMFSNPSVSILFSTHQNVSIQKMISTFRTTYDIIIISIIIIVTVLLLLSYFFIITINVLLLPFGPFVLETNTKIFNFGVSFSVPQPPWELQKPKGDPRCCV